MTEKEQAFVYKYVMQNILNVKRNKNFISMKHSSKNQGLRRGLRSTQEPLSNPGRIEHLLALTFIFPRITKLR